MNTDVFPPSPVFVASIQELKLYDAAQELYGFFHECMGTIVTGLHLLTICSCVTIFDEQDKVFLLKLPGAFVAVAGTDNLSRIGARRQVTNFFVQNNFCGGIPRTIDLGLVKIDHPWDPTPEFGVANLGISPDKSYYDYVIKTKHMTAYDCYVYSWINRESIEEEWKPYDPNAELERNKKTYFHTLDECYPFNMDVNGVIRTVNESTRDDKFCTTMSVGRGCGVDKGAPLICRNTNPNNREIFLAGIGLGGVFCTPGVESRSLFQGFKDSLSFLRFYLALDDTFITEKSSGGAGRALSEDEDPFSIYSIGY